MVLEMCFHTFLVLALLFTLSNGGEVPQIWRWGNTGGNFPYRPIDMETTTSGTVVATTPFVDLSSIKGKQRFQIAPVLITFAFGYLYVIWLFIRVVYFFELGIAGVQTRHLDSFSTPLIQNVFKAIEEKIGSWTS